MPVMSIAPPGVTAMPSTLLCGMVFHNPTLWQDAVSKLHPPLWQCRIG